jgi:hypothetical protein
MLSFRARCTSDLIVDLDSLLNRYLARIDLCITGMYLLLILASLLPYMLVPIKLLNRYLARIDLCITGSGEEVQRGLDPPASELAIFAMAERASYDDSFAAAPRLRASRCP